MDVELSAKIAALEAERDAIALERDALKGDHAKLKSAYDTILTELEKLRRQIFGRKAEGVDSTQASLAFQIVMGLVAQPPAEPSGPATEPAASGADTSGPGDGAAAPSGKDKGADKTSSKPHGRRDTLPEHLPIERVELLPPGVTAQNRHLYDCIDEEVSETLEWRSASLVRMQVVRPKFVLRRVAKKAAADVQAQTADGAEGAGDASGGVLTSPVDPSPMAASDASETTPTTSAPTCVPQGVPSDLLGAMAPGAGSCRPPARSILIAPLPERAIARCMAGPGLLAHVLVQKYCYHMPLYRLERMFANEGVDLARSTLCGWVEAAATLLKVIVDAMATDALKSPWIGIDATGVLVQAKEQCRRAHFWVLVAARDHVLFRFSARHVKEAPKEFLKGYTGFVQADASSVYELLYRTENVTEVGCHAHCRRGFFDALGNDKERALAGIGFINKLFEFERELKELPPSRRLEERLQRSKPILDAFEAWVDGEVPHVLPKSPIAAALGYAINQRIPLRRFLDDGRLRIDNNLSELELRRQKVGAKNWLFLGSDDGAEWNTTVVSLVASCELHGLDPFAYLRDVLTVINGFPKHRVLELAPKYWRQTRELPLVAGLLLAADPPSPSQASAPTAAA